jgi:hypothetical protein
LPAGKYSYEVERGHEYRHFAGEFKVAAGDDKTLALTPVRMTDMAAQKWYSGEMHVHRKIEDIELLMRAEDLHVAPIITWWNKTNFWKDRPLPEDPLVKFDGDRYYHLMGGEDEREGGAFMYFNRARPLDFTAAKREYPSPIEFMKQARAEGDVWIDVEKPFWYDVPAVLASVEVNSIGIANNHMARTRMYDQEAWGKKRDTQRLPGPLGNGRWSQELYYHVLNCGFRIPPSAGSASGVLDGPFGYNRVYVHVDGELTYEKWWAGLKAGRAFVTNGPLLIAEANGESPGHVFSGKEGTTLQIRIVAKTPGATYVPKTEIIKNGQIVKPGKVRGTGRGTFLLGTITFDRSGWFLLRTIDEDPNTFRFASTAPYYVEIGPSKRSISKASAQLFLDWVDERIALIEQRIDDPAKLKEVLAYHHEARKFWQDKVAAANTP